MSAIPESPRLFTVTINNLVCILIYGKREKKWEKHLRNLGVTMIQKHGYSYFEFVLDIIGVPITCKKDGTPVNCLEDKHRAFLFKDYMEFCDSEFEDFNDEKREAATIISEWADSLCRPHNQN